MRNLAAVAALLLTIAPESAAAAQFTVKLSDFSSSDVIGVTVKGGIVAGFRRVLARSTGSLTVGLPDGLCEARVRISFENGRIVDRENFNFCTEGRVTVVGR